jgi:acyl carrier protein
MDRVTRVLDEVFDSRAEAARSAASFREVEGFDSLAFIDLVAAFEREFTLDLSAEEVQEILSYEGMRTVLEARGIAA